VASGAIRQQLHLDRGFEHGFEVDQHMHDDGERRRTAGPAEPAEGEARGEDLRHAEPVVLNVQQSPGQRNDDNGELLIAGAYQPAVEKAAERDLLPDRRNHNNGEHQPEHPAGVLGALIGFDLKRRHEVPSTDKHQYVEHEHERDRAQHGKNDLASPGNIECEIAGRRPAPQPRGDRQHRNLHRDRRQCPDRDHHAVVG